MATRLPEAVRLAHEFKADLLKGESGHQFEMARRYLDVEQRLQDRIVALTDKVALMRAAGQEVNVGKLYLLDRWQSLEKQMLSELSSFNGWALERIKDRQVELGRQGVANAADLMRAVGLTGSFDKLPVDAVTAMVGMAGDGAPIRELLAESYPQTADTIAQRIVDGVALGRSPDVVARDAADGLGIPLDRAFLVARTEELRAYRTGSQMQYTAAGITQYRRLATLDDATCIGCLAADGEIMDNADAFDAHPACRCTSVPIVEEATMPEWQSSEDWFNAQDAATQEGIMGPGRLEAYESGAASWSDMFTRVDDPVWGGSIVPTNVSDLAGTTGAEVVQAAEAATAEGMAEDSRAERLVMTPEYAASLLTGEDALAYARLSEKLGDRLLFEGEEMTEHMAMHLRDLASLPDNVLDALGKENVPLGTIHIGKGGVPEFDTKGYLRGVRPRGWPPGSTWDKVSGCGAARPGDPIILGDLTEMLGGRTGSGSASTALHEVAGHGIDAIVKWSESSEWKAAQREVWDLLPPYQRQGGKGAAAGMQEFVAESIAGVVSGKGRSWTTPEVEKLVWKALGGWPT
jgi:SPP1 gp7 family putative phage head morphogenesis protein